jgi:hypothetical protein
MKPLPQPASQSLRQLLTRRLAIIADHALRESDPSEQLRQLQAVSEELQKFHSDHQSLIPQRLNHFLTQSSYQKALDWLDQESPEA